MTDLTLHTLQWGVVLAIIAYCAWKHLGLPALKAWIRQVVREGDDERHQAGQG